MPVQKNIGQKKISFGTAHRRQKILGIFPHIERPIISNLEIKVNFRGSFEIDSKTGVSMAELWVVETKQAYNRKQVRISASSMVFVILHLVPANITIMSKDQP